MTSEEEYKARFLSRLAPPDENGCQRWLGTYNGDGYGKMWIRGKFVKSHLLACMFAGRIVTFGCHTCHNKWCSNEAHVVQGNEKLNAAMEGAAKLSATAKKAHATRKVRDGLPRYVTREFGKLRVRWKGTSLGFVDTVEEALKLQEWYNGISQG